MRESDRAFQQGRVPNHTLSSTLGKTFAAVAQPRSPDCNNDCRQQKLFYSLLQETGTSSATLTERWILHTLSLYESIINQILPWIFLIGRTQVTSHAPFLYFFMTIFLINYIKDSHLLNI